jgi:hypothetical protein
VCIFFAALVLKDADIRLQGWVERRAPVLVRRN